MKRWVVVLAFIGMAPRAEASDLDRLEKAWGLSPVKSHLRHEDEGIHFHEEQKRLELSVWYEDSSITKDTEPSRRLYCRLAHTLIYGRAVIRSKATQLLPSRAFNQLDEIDSIELNFYAVRYTNEATPPHWEQAPEPPPAEPDSEDQLRVLWTRKESVIPYLKLRISRKEWQSIQSKLKAYPSMSFTDFYKDLCPEVFPYLTDIRANFQALEADR